MTPVPSLLRGISQTLRPEGHQLWMAWHTFGTTSNNVVPCIVKTRRSLWFHNSDFDKRIPVRPDGDLLERSTSKRRATVSSGRTG